MGFSVGEIVIIQSQERPEFNGIETEVLSNYNGYSGTVYICTVQPKPFVANGFLIQGWQEAALRKKKPPKDEDRYDGNDVIPWDDCIWQPERVT